MTTKEEQELLLKIVSDWNAAVGTWLERELSGQRARINDALNQRDSMQRDLTLLLTQASEQLDKNPVVAADLLKRALRRLS